MLNAYIIEFASLMTVFAFVIVSPGADTAMVMRQSVLHGRQAGIFTAFGLGASLLTHLTYTILGLGLIVAQSLLLFSLIKWAGALYLIYMGVQALRAPAPVFDTTSTSVDVTPSRANLFKSFGLGFITNALNPKPVLFFLSLFSALVSHETPALVKGFYGLGMASCLILWFTLVSCFLTMPRVRLAFTKAGLWINRVTGAVFIGFGVKLALARAE